MRAWCDLGPSHVPLGQWSGLLLIPSAPELPVGMGGGTFLLAPRHVAQAQLTSSVNWEAVSQGGTWAADPIMSDVTFPSERWAVLYYSWEYIFTSSACVRVCACV